MSHINNPPKKPKHPPPTWMTMRRTWRRGVRNGLCNVERRKRKSYYAIDVSESNALRADRNLDTFWWQVTHAFNKATHIINRTKDMITECEYICTHQPNGLRARITQELNELRAILAMTDSHLENIDHTQIEIPPLVPIDKLLNDFMGSLDVLEMDDLESDNDSLDTPLISPFLDLDDELDDGEVLNELDKYENAGNFYHDRIINSVDGDDLAFPCMIGFRKFVAYFDLFLPMNIITLKAYNTIMAEGLESTWKNLVAIVRDVYVFIGSFIYVTDFTVLKDIGEFIVSDMLEVVMGRPFRAVTQLEYDCVKG
nr:hypothetical protein [Tanacetum cinerariifolium]